MPESPTTSVIVPYFNARATLGAALESLYAQTVRATEILVVDDGSAIAPDDSTLARMQEHGSRLIRTENSGAAKARNHGVRMSRGDIVFFLDADDLWKPELIARVLGAFEREHPAAVGFRHQWMTEDGRLMAFQNRHFPVIDLKLVIWKNPFGICFACRRDVFLKYGGLDETQHLGEDSSFIFSMVAGGEKFIGLEDVLYLYRKTHGSLTHQTGRYLVSACHLYGKYFRKTPPRLWPHVALSFLRATLVTLLLPLREALITRQPA